MTVSAAYLRRLPDVVPVGRVLIHNHVLPTRRLGSRGFRAWLAPSNAPQLEVCACTWASELGRHFRPRRVKSADNAGEVTPRG